jgi:Xaa-Pro aminopeptidase
MIHSVEPGAYSPAFGGVRTEDDVLITAAGAEVLGPFDRSAGPTGS